MASLSTLVHSVRRGYKYRIIPLIGAVLHGKKKKGILQELRKRTGISLPFLTYKNSIIPMVEYDIQLSTHKTVEAIIIKQLGRLGNELIQLINGLYIAKKIGIHTIYLDWKPSFMNEDIYIINGITIHCDRKESTQKCCLISTFFYFQKQHLESLIPEDEYRQLNHAIYTGLLKPEMKKKPVGINPDDLIIHIRSGDIFGSGYIHPRYGQPPLAYYIQVLKIAKPARVILIYENTANPCIPALINYLSRKNIPSIHFCKSLEETVALLLHAKNICYGFGSFVTQIILLSKTIKGVGYTYNDVSNRVYEKFKTLYTFKEKNIDYQENVLKKWKNTKKQRKKMVEYTHGKFKVYITKNNS